MQLDDKCSLIEISLREIRGKSETLWRVVASVSPLRKISCGTRGAELFLFKSLDMLSYDVALLHNRKELG